MLNDITLPCGIQLEEKLNSDTLLEAEGVASGIERQSKLVQRLFDSAKLFLEEKRSQLFFISLYLSRGGLLSMHALSINALFHIHMVSLLAAAQQNCSFLLLSSSAGEVGCKAPCLRAP